MGLLRDGWCELQFLGSELLLEQAEANGQGGWIVNRPCLICPIHRKSPVFDRWGRFVCPLFTILGP
jgi:hypothetical protein